MTRETVTLQYPVTVDGEDITELTLRRPRVADLKRAEKHKDNFEKSIRIIADLAEVSPKVVEELDASDFAAVSARVGEYMGASDASA